MSRPCKWCGVFFKDVKELCLHEQAHRDLDNLNGNFQLNTDAKAEQDMGVETADHASLNVHDIRQGPYCCDACGTSYLNRKHLLTHIRAQHEGQTYSCSECQKVFRYRSSMNRHKKSCKKKEVWHSLEEHVCPQCGKRCSTTHGLQRHVQAHGNKSKLNVKNRQRLNKRPSSTQAKVAGSKARSQQFRCRRCTDVFDNRRDLYLHGVRQHYVNQHGGSLQPRPWGRDADAPWGEDNALQRVYEANSQIILENHRQAPVQSVYNFPVTNEINLNQLMRYAEDVYEREQRAFRINLVFGVILQNRESGHFRYFVPYTNSGIFESPIYISRRGDLLRLRRELQRKDIFTELLRLRPDTKWIPVLVTNVHFLVNETYYPLGQGQLPDYLMKKDSLYPLVRNQHTFKPYKDNLCVFRCLALHHGYDIRSLEGPTKQFYMKWTDKAEDEFQGLSFEEFPTFETCFEVNLEVYNLTEDSFAYSVYKSRGKHETTMFVNMYENHLSYIRNFALYAQKYQCRTCERHFKQVCHLHRHQKTCTNKTRFVYPGGFHRERESIFDQLDQYDIHVREKDRTFKWHVCFDIECLLEKIDDCPTKYLQWTQKHVPVSVSICSNVEGYTEPVCIVNADQDQLVQSMVMNMNEIANRVYELAEEKWGWVLEAINTKINEHNLDLELENGSGDEIEDETNEKETKKTSHPLQKIYGYMESYMSQVPVLGFNSAKYDLNALKRCLAKHLNMHEDSNAFVVKKSNAYTCIATESLKFLDMSQFLAAGSSYAGFLKAYHVEEQKGFFPYEWFDNITKLECTSLPPHESFYSHLKGTNISEEEYVHCQRIWRDRNMITFKDYLKFYNNLDVQPFVEAVKNFQQFYFEKGIDVFKTAISVPGIARQMLFKTARKQNVNFALFDEQNKDLYETIKHNIVGGPSIIFTRHHCAGQTKIRGGKPCGSILGYDANALYLYAIGQPMPVGPFVRRLSNNDFRPELRDKYMSAYYWMDWLIQSQGLAIEHKLNTGREVRVGKYPVDGFVPATNTEDKGIVFQFHGCYWHGHQCDITKSIKDEKWQATRAERFQRTHDTSVYLKKDHNVVEMWECQFRQYCRQTPAIYDFIDSRRPGFFQNHKGKISENTILEGVDTGALFGMVEVDIEVPQQWPSYFKHPTKTPYDYFQEMSPLFCTTEIPFDAIGEHMQKHIRSHDLSEKPRKLLVGGMRARQILLATPLLRWYLNHGMIVTKIYQLVEYQEQRCFREFAQEVSDARRKGDVNPDTAIIADTMKVIGNSGYGSMIMDKTKHRNIHYIQGENETCLKVNDPLFQKLECLDPEDQYYELEMGKRKIKLDLPIQLGYYILQYAKLRMLEFYYDFIDAYVDRSNWEYAEMDTDSAYMAITGSSLEEVIKPEMKERFQLGLKGFCTDDEIEADADLHWFPRSCCSKHAKYDKRTPGLFKLEYQGDEMIGLCSKTYIVRKTKLIKPSSTRIIARQILNRAKGVRIKRKRLQSHRINEFKFSSKGVSKRHLKYPMVKFRAVLKTGKSESSINLGFRQRNNAVYTYTQERRGFSYLYCKRKVLDDGIHTVPLDITLCPLPSQEESDVNDQELIDMLASNFED